MADKLAHLLRGGGKGTNLNLGNISLDRHKQEMHPKNEVRYKSTSQMLINDLQ